MRDSPLLTVLLVAVIVAFAAVAVLVITADSDKSDADEIGMNDLVGHWYLVYDAKYSDDGYTEATVSSDPNINNRDLDIYGYDGDVFYGSQFDKSIVGSYVDGVLKFTTYLDEDYSLCRGYIDTKDVFTVVNAHAVFDGDVIEELIVSVQVYTSDISKAIDEFEAPGYEDITGKWYASADCLLVNGNYSTFGFEYMDVTKQHKNLFDCDYNVLSSMEDRVARCAMIEHNNRYSGVGITSEGRVMLLDLNNDVFSCTNVSSNESYTYAVYGAFTRSGDPVSSEESGLVDTTWRVTGSNSITGEGTVEKEIRQFTLTFDEEKDHIIKGTWSYGLEKKDLAGYVKRNSIGLLVEFVWNEEDRSDVFKIGYLLDSGVMTLSDIYVDDLTGEPTAHTYELKQVINDNMSLVGHWYISDFAGYDIEYISKTPITNPELATMDFDIYAVSDDGLFYGYISGTTVVGTYADGLITLEGYVFDTLYMTATGWLEADNTMSVVVTQYDETGRYMKDALIYYATFTKDRGAVTNLESDFSILGNWTAVNPRSMTAEGEIVDMYGTNMTIDFQKGSIFSGMMEQTEGSKIVNLFIKGCIVVTPWGTIQGKLIDDNGLTWNIQYVLGETENEDIMMINATDISPATPIAGEMDTVERRYHRADVEDPGFKYMDDLKGRTWCGTTLYTMDRNGKEATVELELSVSVSYQFDNNVAGKISYSADTVSGDSDWVGFLINSVGQPMFRLQINDLDYGICCGSAWSYNGKCYMIVSFDKEGSWYSSIIELTEVIS